MREWHLKSILAVFCAAVLLAGCMYPGKPAPVENVYTAESTYQKLVTAYPFIQIASQTAPASVKVIRDISYVSYKTRELQLDLFLPAQVPKNAMPGIILVHGGGWRSGSRENLSAMAIRLSGRGYVAATISYRLSAEAQYPAAIHDVKAAVRWMRSHATEFHIDTAHIAVAGGSAGGQIAALVGVTNGVPKFDPQAQLSQVSSAVQAVVNIDGLSDFTSEQARFYEDNPVKKPSSAGAWLGGTYAEKTELWKEASPLSHVSKNTPPILFIGSAQKRFSLGREEMVQKMKTLDITTRVVLMPDTPHSFWLFDPWLEPTVDAISEFLGQEFHM